MRNESFFAGYSLRKARYNQLSRESFCTDAFTNVDVKGQPSSACVAKKTQCKGQRAKTV